MGRGWGGGQVGGAVPGRSHGAAVRLCSLARALGPAVAWFTAGRTMRIVGGRDYYDSALAFGHDVHTTFVRGREQLSVPDAEELGIEPARRVIELHPAAGRREGHEYHPEHETFSEVTVRGTYHHQNFVTVIACGKRFQGIRIASWTDSSVPGRGAFFWNWARLEGWLAEHGLRAETVRSGDDLDARFDPVDVSDAVREALIARGWTLLVHDPPRSWVDCSRAAPWLVDQDVIKQVEFFRAVPPNTMFQEIDMWIGGRLSAAAPEMVEISDEVRLAKHGMGQDVVSPAEAEGVSGGLARCG
jgi:hypothetical protein